MMKQEHLDFEFGMLFSHRHLISKYQNFKICHESLPLICFNSHMIQNDLKTPILPKLLG